MADNIIIYIYGCNYHIYVGNPIFDSNNLDVGYILCIANIII